MRWGQIAWCVIGVGLIGGKAYLDLSAERYGDVAVRAGDVVYRIPRALVTNAEGWRADVSRVTGCWDVRDAGVAGWFGGRQSCRGAKSLHLDLARLLGEERAMLSRYAMSTVFWRAYTPPSEHVRDIEVGWNARVLSYREDWQLHRLEVAGSPWVYLFSSLPRSVSDASRSYAGRCYRSDVGSDIGMTCTVVLSFAGGAALEYSMSADAVPEFALLQTQARTLVESWR